MPMGNELKMAPQKRSGQIFENVPTSHAVSLALFMYACSDSAIPLLSCACLWLPYAITANGVCLHLFVPPLAQCCFFGGCIFERKAPFSFKNVVGLFLRFWYIVIVHPNLTSPLFLNHVTIVLNHVTIVLNHVIPVHCHCPP